LNMHIAQADRVASACALHLVSPFIHNESINNSPILSVLLSSYIARILSRRRLERKKKQRCAALRGWLWWQALNGDAQNLLLTHSEQASSAQHASDSDYLTK